MEDLVKLKQQKDKLDTEISVIELDKSTFITDFKRTVLDFLQENSVSCAIEVSEFRIKFIFPHMGYYSNDILLTNNHNPSEFQFIPKLSWSSGSISDNDIYTLEYIKSIGFLGNLFNDSNNDFFKIVKKFFRKNYRTNTKIDELTKEVRQISRKIFNIELQIRKEKFYSKLNPGNFYFNYTKQRFGGGIYEVYYIEKINNKTTTVVSFSNRSLDIIKSYITNLNRFKKYRIRNEDVFNTLESYTVFRVEDVENVFLNHNIKINMKNILENYDISYIKDIKLLCETLFNNGIIDKKVPNNDVLSIISEKRHYAIKYGEVN